MIDDETEIERGVNRALKGCPWEWRTDGALVTIRLGGKSWSVFVPLEKIEWKVNSELAGVGCGCIEPAVGYDDYHAVGFFGRITRFARKAVRSVSRAAKSTVRAVVPKAIRNTGAALYKSAYNVARKAAKFATDPKVLRIAGFASMVIPGIGPAVAAGLITAAQLRQVAGTVYRAGQLATQALQGGVRSNAAQQAAQRGLAAADLLRSLPA